MATEVGQAYVTLIPSAKGFASKMQSELAGDLKHAGQSGGDDYAEGFNKEVASETKKKAPGISKAFGAAMLSGFAALGIGKFIGDAFAEANEAAQVGARTENVIKSMGDVAGISAGQVADLAGALSEQAGMDDEAIQSGENMLLTFGSIRDGVGKNNDIFTQTTKLMVDMSKAMGTDATSSATMLGKALNNPTKGVSALTRVGVSFTDQQTEQIKKLQESGDVLGAQKIILGEVKKQFGGAGAAMATPGEKAAVAWGNLKEDIGTKLMPVLTLALDKFMAILPQVEDFAGVVADTLAPAFQQAYDTGSALFNFLSDHTTTLKVLVGIVGALVAIMLTYNAVVAIAEAVTTAWSVATKLAAIAQIIWTNAVWLFNIALAANPIGLIIIAVIALIAVIVVVVHKLVGWGKVWDGIKKGADTVWKGIKAAFNKVKAVILGVVNWAKTWIKNNWKSALLVGLLGPLGLIVVLVRKKWDSIKDAVRKGAEAVVNFIKGLPGRIRSLGSKFAEAGKAIIGKFVDGMKNATGIVSGIAGNVWDALRGLLNGAIDRLNNALEFSIHVPGKTFSVNPPDIPHLARGGRVTSSTLAVIGEGREPETVLPDSMLAGLIGAGGGGGDMSGELTITNWDDGTGYFRVIASDELAASARFERHLGAMHA